MELFEFRNRKYQVDLAGFLVNSGEWDENFAEGMAAEVRIPGGLTGKHWKVILWIRDYYRDYGKCPLVYQACRANGLRLSTLKALFPTGYQRGACRLAGLTYKEGFLGYSDLPESAEEITPLDAEKNYLVNALGFLIDPSAWDRQFAIFKAHELKLPGRLTAKHWQVIGYLRDSYQKSKTVPTVYETCEANNLEVEELEGLFPDGYHRGAVKIAGLRLR